MPHTSSTVPLTPVPSAAARSIRSSAIRDLLAVTARPDILGLAGGLPATELIPAERIAREVAAALGDPETLQYTLSAGTVGARTAVAAYEGVAPDDVLVTHGSQQALSLLATALVDPGDVVVVDDPVYVGARQAFEAVRADIRGLPLTPGGIDTELLERWCRDGLRPRVVHTVATFHNPGGVTADDDRRSHLARLADTYGFWVVDDNPYGRLRFRGTDPGPIRRHGGRVISLGSASKILAPALRVGWLLAPPEVVATVERVRQSADLCGSSLTQSVTAALLDDTAWLDAHVDGLCRAYGDRAEALVGALRTELPDDAEITRPDGGMFSWVRVPGLDATACLTVAAREGVAFVPGPAFAVERDLSDCLRVSYATLRPDDLRIAASRLGRAVAISRGRRAG
ncbi:aminotransferase-like domain-containing protein [Williamsia deligens]|uniref:PLP-dependent aminotransferase family protein n=1 Tax=Williamsia deligens TaxID=321325 RepID=A0ABW3G9B9_9NOCA|nr:PLP-dependent aminotransferase family protein [Williamsia deligens]MCP2196162.1 2-aminoadipate transaminase [Williamsia deligens]